MKDGPKLQPPEAQAIGAENGPQVKELQAQLKQALKDLEVMKVEKIHLQKSLEREKKLVELKVQELEEF